MIREALSTTAGMLAHAVAHCAPARWLRVRVINVKLQLLHKEIVDTCDDIADAKHDAQVLGTQGLFIASRDRWFDAEALTDLYVALCNERDDLYALRRELQGVAPIPDTQPTERTIL